MLSPSFSLCFVPFRITHIAIPRLLLGKNSKYTFVALLVHRIQTVEILNRAHHHAVGIRERFSNLPHPLLCDMGGTHDDAKGFPAVFPLLIGPQPVQSAKSSRTDLRFATTAFCDMKADYERQIIALTDVLARLNAERAELANGVKSEHPALVAFTKHQNIDQLSRELLVELIDHIKVYENGNISVRFKFADEFRRIAEYIEINTTKPAVAG